MTVAGELKSLSHAWWGRGCGAATLLLLVVATVFRSPRDLIFWAAILFFAVHVAASLVQYLRGNKLRRATVSVTRTHATQPVPRNGVVVFTPMPANSLIVDNTPNKRSA